MMKVFAMTLLALSPAGVVAFAPSNTASLNPSSLMAEAEATTETTNAAAEKTIFDNEFLNEDELFAKSTFPIQPDALMERAQYILGPQCGIGTKDGAECLAPDFEFCAAVVGPIPRVEYIEALENFNLEDSFDITSNFFGLTVDPMQPNRVWFLNRVRGIHTGEFLVAKPTGKEIVYPPQTLHLDFNEDGKVKEFGFYTSDRRQGNTGGLGGAFGFMYGVGKSLPIPEFQPNKRSKRFRLLNLIGRIASKFQKK